MDDARGISPRSTVDALVYGLMCIPKLIALAILLFLVELAVFLVIAILLFICKIPFLGPVLFAVVFPVSVVVAGITVLGLFLCMVLSLPAIWQGASIMRALSQTLAIARSRIVEAILLLAVVWLLAAVVALIVFGVLLSGLLPTVGISASILNLGGLASMMGGMGGMGGMSGMGGMGGGGAGMGHAIAGFLGIGVLYAVASSLVASGLPARPVHRLPARHRRARPQRHRSGAAAEARGGAQPRQRSRRQGACRRQPRHCAIGTRGDAAAALHPAGPGAAVLLSRRHGRERRGRVRSGAATSAAAGIRTARVRGSAGLRAPYLCAAGLSGRAGGFDRHRPAVRRRPTPRERRTEPCAARLLAADLRAAAGRSRRRRPHRPARNASPP
jgi:hypothetical protein